jgi:hypothetical protein
MLIAGVRANELLTRIARIVANSKTSLVSPQWKESVAIELVESACVWGSTR